MRSILLPTWLIVLIIGLPILSETTYTPTLPNIAAKLAVSEPMVEYTLTIYLFGFALGTLFWGKLSDRYGRKPCVLAGLIIFILGCMGGYVSHNIMFLLASRTLQAIGASIGSVIGQAICRDVFQGPALGKAYSTNNSFLAMFPAVGPIIGGLIAENYGWQHNFLFLGGFTIFMILVIIKYLPETRKINLDRPVLFLKIVKDLLKDRKVLGFGLIVAASNGISFSYFAEGSFYLIKLLHLSPSEYGSTFIITSLGGILGGIISKKLHNYCSSKVIMHYGILVTIIASAFFSIMMLLNNATWHFSNNTLILITISSQMFMVLGICIITSTSLALALVDYNWCIGTASSLFGFFYYGCISLVTLFMGLLRNNTLLPMPIYFFCLASSMWFIEKWLLAPKK